MTITTPHAIITRNPERLKKVYYSPSLGLCVEHRDNTGVRTLTNVKKIEM